MSLQFIKTDVEDVKSIFSVCCTCLSADRKLYPLMKIPQVFEIFELLMYDFSKDHTTSFAATWICFECLAVMRKIFTFKWKVHTAQEHLQNLSLNQDQEITGPLLSLSLLTTDIKSGFDKMYKYTVVSPPVYEVMITNEQDSLDEIHLKDQEQGLSENIMPNYYDHTANSSGAMPTLFIKPMITLTNPAPRKRRPKKVDIERPLNSQLSKSTSTVPPQLTTGHDDSHQMSNDTELINLDELDKLKAREMLSYTTEYMSDVIMHASREEAKRNVNYTTEHKCELCLMSFSCSTSLNEHIDSLHTPKPDMESCKICQVYVKSTSMISHTHRHHLMFTCKVCSHTEYNGRLMQLHIKEHREDLKRKANKHIKKKDPNDPKYKTIMNGLAGYKCGKCDNFFTSRYGRQTHIASVHGEKLQCDYCKKFYLNKPSLISHIRRQHDLKPRQQCSVRNKMMESSRIDAHLRRHNTRYYVCARCNVAFSSKRSYNAHILFNRCNAHAKLSA